MGLRGQVCWDSSQVCWAGGQVCWAGAQVCWAGGQVCCAGGQVCWAVNMSTHSLFEVLDKSTNKSKRRRASSEPSNNNISDSVTFSNDMQAVFTPSLTTTTTTYKLKSEITYVGGFTHLVPSKGSEKFAFVFPTTKILSPKEREKYVREYISVLYNVKGDQTESKISEILERLAPPPPKTVCEKIHVQEFSQARNLSHNVEHFPSSSCLFKTPDPQLAPSTPGPRVSRVPDVNTPHTPDDSLRIINYLQMSEDDCRYVRKIALVGLSSEYSVKKLRSQLLGNGGKGYVQSEKLSVKKWFREEKQELQNYVGGVPKRQDVIIGRIPSDQIHLAVQHWADQLTDRGEYVDLQQFENCPEILRDSVVVVMGNDSGRGFCREGLRFCNRENANHGSKIFVTTMVEGSDKGFSMYQKQEFFSSLSGLRGHNTIKMGGKVRKLFKFSAMDYEAAHEDFGTQVCYDGNRI